MAQNFLTCDRDQPLLLPPDLRDWLEEDHLAWFVIEAIEELDLDAFYASYRADGHGRAAHDPKMMLTLLTYAYAVGERSSRGIERRCREDVAFRVICANQVPDHATIARFRVRHEQALADIFGQVLGLCAEAGLVRTGVLAVDGSKFAADGLRLGDPHLREDRRGDPRRGRPHRRRRGRALRRSPRRRAARAREHAAKGRRAWLQEAKQRLDAERAAGEEPVPTGTRGAARALPPPPGRGLAGGAPRKPRLRGLATTAACASDGTRRMGSGRRSRYEPPAKPEGKINTTDPDARRMKFGRNFIPAYNAQAVTTEDQIVVAAEITTEGGDFEQLEPMVSAAERELEGAGVERAPRGRAGRRRLLVERPHRRAPRARHDPDRRPRHDPQPTAKDTPRRALRLHAKSDRHRERRRPLLTKTVHGRAGLRPDQVEPADRSASNDEAGRPFARNGA